MGNFISKTDLKTELEIASDNTDYDTWLDLMTNAVESLWDQMTNRTWFKTAFTDYYDSPRYTNKVFLDNYPVTVTPALTIHDDPDWVWGSDTLIDSDQYRADYIKGIIHYNAYFFNGNQSIKVGYTAGYAADDLPKAIKQLLVRQACHWFKQGKGQIWDVSSESQPAGAGTLSFKGLQDNLLPDFIMMAGLEQRNNG